MKKYSARTVLAGYKIRFQNVIILLVSFFLLVQVSCASPQESQIDSISYEGYTLFNPQGSKITYLIDHAGKVTHRWESKYRTGNSVYLLENGNLLRSATLPAEFGTAGGAGRVEELNWEGELVWAFEYSDETVHFHHDIEPLPNGNILMVAWERISAAEALAAGRDSDLIPGDDAGNLWVDHVIELDRDGEIIWEWHIMDHLIQDLDADKANYGIIDNHPELINVNYLGTHRVSNDWNHVNAVDYSPELDQILLSVRNFGEVWVIDHSTTTEEAAADQGDLLYRWGNPAAYNRGDESDQVFFGQHDAKWLTDDLPGAGNIMVFNNGGDSRPFSSVDEIVPPLNTVGEYSLGSSAYGPDAVTWHYEAPEPSDFFSDHISGAQRLPNGNTLICSGADAWIFEVTMDGEIIWEYHSPFEVASSRTVKTKNSIFRAEKYAPEYPGLASLNQID